MSREEEFEAYKYQVGKCMGEIYLSILEPIFEEHPDLLPENLGGSFKMDKDFQRQVVDSCKSELSKMDNSN